MSVGHVVAGADFAAVVHSAFVEAVARAGQGTLRIALSGGSTPRVLFERLKTTSLPWERMEWYWVDERFVQHTDARSNAGEAKRILFDHVPAAQIYPYAEPREATLEEAAERYQMLLADRLECFDLMLLGVGDDGHTASLFPDEPEVHFRQGWVLPIPARQGRDPRLTLSAPMIVASREILVLAQGERKIGPLRRARGLDPTSLSETPAALLQEARGALTFVVDDALARAIER